MKFIVLTLALIGVASGYAIDKAPSDPYAGSQHASSHHAGAAAVAQPAVVIGIPANAGHLSGSGLAYGGAHGILIPARPIHSIAAAQGAAVSQAYSAGYQQGLANSQYGAYEHNIHGSAHHGHAIPALVVPSHGKY